MTNFITETTTANVPATVSAAATDTVDVTKAQALNLIETLVADKANWEQTAYKTSNDLLYSLLQRCYGYYVVMCENSPAGKAAREALKEYIAKHNYAFKDSTHNITKIVKCVFGADRRRVSAYSIALRTAYANDVKLHNIVSFIIENGGVEEIRLAKSKTALTQAQKVERASASVASTVLFNFKSAEVTKTLDVSNVGKQIVLIATQGADGELAINAVINSEAAAKAALVAYYSATKKAAVAAETAEVSKQPQQAAAEAVESAAVQLAA